MPDLLMFAYMRELAGTSRAKFEGSSVTQVLDEARAQYGPEFASLIPYCRTFVDGVVVADDAELLGTEEVALVPPVSGGC